MTSTGLSFDAPFTGDPDATLPYAGDYDAIETTGSLALIEPAHSANPFVGVPAAGDMLPNILWERLSDARVAASLAAATAANSGFTRKLGNGAAGGGDVANKLITERTGKGGLHAIYSQTNNTVANVALALWGGSDLATYLNSFAATHDFYLSIWDRVTRVPANPGAGPAEAMIYNTNTANMLIMEYETGFGGALLGSKQVPTSPAAATGARFRCAGIDAPTGSGAANNLVIGVGPTGPFYHPTGSGYANLAASRVIYRYYLEDLTVSGRTYAQVQDLDYGLWQEAFGTGGRYAADTYTTPAI